MGSPQNLPFSRLNKLSSCILSSWEKTIFMAHLQITFTDTHLSCARIPKPLCNTQEPQKSRQITSLTLLSVFFFFFMQPKYGWLSGLQVHTVGTSSFSPTNTLFFFFFFFLYVLIFFQNIIRGLVMDLR